MGKTKPVLKKFYEDYLLNEWIKREKNQIRLVHEVFKEKTGFIFKEIQDIIDFEEIHFDINDPENKHTQEVLEDQNRREKTSHLILEKLYDKNVKDYLITVKALDMFGLSFKLYVLCEVRSRYIKSPYACDRIRDQAERYNDDLYDPKQQTMGEIRFGEEVTSKHFASVFVTTDTRSTGHSLKFYNIDIYKVKKDELDNIANQMQGSKIRK